jgi:hypothetical protein
MASNFSVSVDLSNLIEIGPIIRAQIFGQLAEAVESTAQAGVERWQRAGLKAPLWDEERRAYAASVRYEMHGQYAATITSDYKYVEDIETGRPAYDMKRMLQTSLKVRTSKKGRRYLIIPFRHNTPGHEALAPSMSADVYSNARELKASRIVGGGMRLSGTGAWDVKTKSPAMVRLRKYVWGDRLGAGHSTKLQTHHRTDPTAGMVRMSAKTPGGKRYSTYMTFRVMAEGQSGWIRRAKPGLFIAKAVADSLQRTADSAFPAAMARDVG